MELTREQIQEVAEDGGTLKLDDDRTLRVRVLPDEDTSLFDDESYGRIAWVEHNHNGMVWDAPRPNGFTGRARKLSTCRGDNFWWEPPIDVPVESLDKLKNLVIDLMDYGFCGVVVEVLSGTDAYGRPIVTDVASLWGIDSLADGYLAEVVSELVYELP